MAVNTNTVSQRSRKPLVYSCDQKVARIVIELSMSDVYGCAYVVSAVFHTLLLYIFLPNNIKG